jgi:predicted RecB family nuclease
VQRKLDVQSIQQTYWNGHAGQWARRISASLEFACRDTHPSGAASVEWFDRWCTDRTPELKHRILDYNDDDCRATRVLLDAIDVSRTDSNMTLVDE